MSMFGILCAYWLIGLVLLHRQPQRVERGSVPDAAMSVFKLSLTWPLWIGRGA